jgi:ABC-type multidrug transport system fused ATPase/permease subunit
MVSHRWLDKTPTGRIIARCTQDIRAVDGPVPEAVMALTELGIALLTKLVVIVIFTPIFVFPSVFIAIFGFFLGNLYLRAQLSVKREMRFAITVLPLRIVDICYSAMRVPLYWLTLVQQLRV